MNVIDSKKLERMRAENRTHFSSPRSRLTRSVVELTAAMRMDDSENAGRFGNRSQPTVSPDDYEDGMSSVGPMAFLPVGNGLSYGDV